MQPEFFFAVTKGSRPGVYTSWEKAREKIAGYQFPEWRGFNSLELAQMAYKARSSCIGKERIASGVHSAGSSGTGSGGVGRPIVSWLPVIPQEELHILFAIADQVPEERRSLLRLCGGPPRRSVRHRNVCQGPFLEAGESSSGGCSGGDALPSTTIDWTGHSKVRMLRDSNDALRARVGELEDELVQVKAKYEAAAIARIDGKSP
ncbi:hypothetical protein PIB30_003904 [Stylosanthes scabra]|uniref:Ribonuclease H1 N-terminal domain-containing protein n=1 Tax=Stylosanthes scabra TaxID=79078 RepID=A0ABU6U3S2_9FABA|nr:hypothetical protein [Stylosanthes scabra]